MPIVSSPNRGYSEFQRINNWDSPVLYSDLAHSLAVPITTPVLDVSRYAYLAGSDIVNGGDGLVGVSWYADQAATVGVGGRTFQLSLNISNSAQYRLPNLGPYAQIVWQKIGAGNPTHTANIFATNRVHPLEFIPQAQVLIGSQSVSVPALGTETLYPSDYYAGPVMFYPFSTQAGTFFLDYLDSADTWDRIEQLSIAASTNLDQILITPPGAWRVRFLNNSSTTAATVTIMATPSTTGAA